MKTDGSEPEDVDWTAARGRSRSPATNAGGPERNAAPKKAGLLRFEADERHRAIRDQEQRQNSIWPGKLRRNVSWRANLKTVQGRQRLVAWRTRQSSLQYGRVINRLAPRTAAPITQSILAKGSRGDE